MSIIEIRAPTIGESINEATIVNINKKIGDLVAKEDVLMVLETDKIALDITSPENGHISEIFVNKGDDVKIGDLLLKIDISNNSIETKFNNDKNKIDFKEDKNKKEFLSSKENEVENKPILSTEVAKIIKDSNVVVDKKEQITQIDTQINKNDQHAVVSSADVASQKKQREIKKIKITRLRKSIAARLKQSQNEAAILTTFNEIDMSNVLEIKKKYSDDFSSKYQIKFGLTSFFVKAASMALEDSPIINSFLEGDYIISHNYCDIGVAISTEKGLVVPILRNVEDMNIVDIERGIKDFAEKAKNFKLEINDLIGGTFSISNGGVYGSLLSTPIINPPQSAILGLHSIKKRPIVENDQIVIRPMMYVALSYDHRIIDGHEAVLFLQKIKEYVEDCSRMLLNI